MQEFQTRVIDEMEELVGKIERLEKFLDGPSIGLCDLPERGRLVVQSMLMMAYAEVLRQRIEAFGG